MVFSPLTLFFISIGWAMNEAVDNWPGPIKFCMDYRATTWHYTYVSCLVWVTCMLLSCVILCYSEESAVGQKLSLWHQGKRFFILSTVCDKTTSQSSLYICVNKDANTFLSQESVLYTVHLKSDGGCSPWPRYSDCRVSYWGIFAKHFCACFVKMTQCLVQMVFKVFQRNLSEIALVFAEILWNDTFLYIAKHDLLPQNTVLSSVRTNYGTKRSPERSPLCLWIARNVVSLWVTLWGLHQSKEPKQTRRCLCVDVAIPFRSCKGDTCSLVFSFSARAVDRCSVCLLFFLAAANPLREGVFVIERRHYCDRWEWVLCHAACHIKKLFQGRLSSVRGSGWGLAKNALVGCQQSCVSHISEGGMYIPLVVASPCCPEVTLRDIWPFTLLLVI